MIKKKIIMGCEGRGDAESPYLTRWELLSCPFGKLYLHKFHRSDHDVLHDHPWDFWTLILWKGYTEHFLLAGDTQCSRRVLPLMFLFRPATFAHRVRLHTDKRGKEIPAISLVFASTVKRDWGFFTTHGWQFWKEYFKDNACK